MFATNSATNSATIQYLRGPPVADEGPNAATSDVLMIGPGTAMTLRINRPDIVGRVDNLRRMVFLVLDVSGSMWSHYETQRAAALSAAEAVRAADMPEGVFYIVFFASVVVRVIDAASPNAIEEIKSAPMGGGTNFRCVFQEILSLHQENNPGACVDVFFSTDGEASDWRAEFERLKDHLRSHGVLGSSHVQPLYFGRAPVTTTSRRGFWGSYPNAWDSLQEMAVHARAMHVQNVAGLVEYIRTSVRSLADEATASFDGHNAPAFSNGETIAAHFPGTTSLEAGTIVNITLFANGEVLATVPVTVEINDTPEADPKKAFVMKATATLANVQASLERAARGDPGAIKVVLRALEAIRKEARMLKISPTDEYYVALQEAHRQLSRVVAESSRSDPRALNVSGEEDAVSKLLKMGRWICTTLHGQTRVKRRTARQAERAIEKALEQLAKHREKVDDRIASIRSLLPTLDDLETIAREAPPDALTLEAVEGLLVAVFTTSGSHVTQSGDMDITAMLATANPAITRAHLQAFMSWESFLNCMQHNVPLIRMSMPAVISVAWTKEKRHVALQELLELNAAILAMQMICGIATLPTSGGVKVFLGVARSVFESNASAAMMLAPYYMELASKQKREGTTVSEIHGQNVGIVNAIALSNAPDASGAIPNPSGAVMGLMFAVQCTPGAWYPERVISAMFETARLALCTLLQTIEPQDQPAYFSGLRETILGSLPTHLTPREDWDPTRFLKRLSPLLRGGKAGTEEIAHLVNLASRLGFQEGIEKLSEDDASVQAALAFLWGLAKDEIPHPSPHVLRARDSWPTLLAIMDQLRRVLGKDSREETVQMADDNGGYLPPSRVPSPRAFSKPTDLFGFLSPSEIVAMALILIDTEGNTSRIRELGRLTLPTHALTPDILNMLKPTEAMKARQKAHTEDFMRKLVKEGLTSRAHPRVMLGMASLAMRYGLQDEAMELIGAVSALGGVCRRADLYPKLLGCIPAGLVTMDPRFKEVFLISLRRILEAQADARPVFDTVSSGMLVLSEVRELFIGRGIPQLDIDARLGCPGKTPPVFNSRKFNQIMVRLVGPDALPTDDEVVALTIDPNPVEDADRTLCVQDASGTLFEPPHNALAVYYHIGKRSKAPECYRIVFRDGTEATRDAQGHWCASLEQNMRLWREEVLTKKTEGGAVKGPSIPDTKSMSVAELTAISESVEACLDGMRRFHYESSEEEESGDEW